jgi:hypothetical protein
VRRELRYRTVTCRPVAGQRPRNKQLYKINRAIMLRQRNNSSSPPLMLLPQHVSVIRPSSGGILHIYVHIQVYTSKSRYQITAPQTSTFPRQQEDAALMEDTRSATRCPSSCSQGTAQVGLLAEGRHMAKGDRVQSQPIMRP